MLRKNDCLLLSALLLVMLAPQSLFAHGGSNDRVQFGRNIVVEQGEETGGLVCIGCSIRMEGTCGDMVTVGGSIVVNGAVNGDIATVGGGVRLGENASVEGDVASIGGRFWRDPNATVKGDISSMSGPLILLALVVVPLLPIIAIVALIVWLVSPNRRAIPARV